jgi:TPR repeat protein
MENENKDSLDITTLIKQAENGDANSQNELAGFYFSQGTYDKAFLWVKKAAEQGLPIAMVNIGKMYNDGIGTPKDTVAAINLFAESIGFGLSVPVQDLDINDIRTSAKNGNANAQLLFGLCYGDGINIEQNVRQSVHWYNKAAEQGHPLALLILGTCFITAKKSLGIFCLLKCTFRLQLNKAQQNQKA